ncbi:hypothetical protein WME89_00760 [Sorangium sp. So ce321]|uniref:hypothetical protein n=1 Tax=Sorangium sp. So ce321 TaxID=3133300 RepID=UPI003F5EB8DE
MTCPSTFVGRSAPARTSTGPEFGGVHLDSAAAPRSTRTRHRPAVGHLAGGVTKPDQVEGDGPALTGTTSRQLRAPPG